MKKALTLCVVLKDNKILLGYKKRGFGQGLWNSFGGKIQDKESLEQAAMRELKEETGFSSAVIKERALMNIDYQHTGTLCEIHIFEVLDFQGRPLENDEMKPEWFDKNAIPYHQMWPNDPHWLPVFMEGKSFEALFTFSDYATLIAYDIKSI